MEIRWTMTKELMSKNSKGFPRGKIQTQIEGGKTSPLEKEKHVKIICETRTLMVIFPSSLGKAKVALGWQSVIKVQLSVIWNSWHIWSQNSQAMNAMATPMELAQVRVGTITNKNGSPYPMTPGAQGSTPLLLTLSDWRWANGEAWQCVPPPPPLP